MKMTLSLYDINQQIASFNFAIDEETGEITNFTDYEALEMARDEKIENTALLIKNLNAEAAAIKAEEKALAKRREAVEHKAERLTNYLADMCAGETFKTPRVAISYRTSTPCEITDEDKLVEWLFEHNRDDLVTVKFTPSKAKVKALIAEGVECPYARNIEKKNIQIR